MLNINNSEDPFYRYKMPELKVEKVNKAGKKETILMNMKEIAKALNREEKEMIKYMGKKRSAGVNIGKGVISGDHNVKDLQEVIYKYIKTYVLCMKCGNPETTKKEEMIKCVACGERMVVEK
jgi:translation initiation factor 2 beta subunit (eIF-2beta)/eIF-5